MKKSTLMTYSIAAAVIAASLAGCGSAKTDGSTDGNNTSIFEQNDSADNSANGQDASQTNTDTTTATAQDNGPSADDANAGQQSDLYEAFKNGEAKAKFRGTADRGSYLILSDVLTPGEAYSLTELADKLGSSESYNYKPVSDPEYRYIDCGNDGNKELFYQQSFQDDSFGEPFTLNMILKDINGELTICYDQDMWSRSSVQVNDDGTIEGDGSGGAALHYTNYSFVDAAGDYHFYYELEETLSPFDDYYSYKDGNYTLVSMDGLDSEHLGIDAYYFESEYEKRSDYTTYFIFDDSYNDITSDADYDASNEVMKRFTDAGIKIYTKSEIKDILDKRAKEINYPVGG